MNRRRSLQRALKTTGSNVEVSMQDYKSTVQRIAALADIEINGTRPWDITVNHSGFYERVIAEGVLGLGESYMDGWWTCEALDQFFYKVISADIRKRLRWSYAEVASLWMTRLLNRQTRAGSKKVVQSHYDPSSKIILSFLDPYNQYTCGYFKDTDDLNTAQEQKLDLICRKLELSAKDRILDIGCGWGGFAKFATERYDGHVTGISISDEQLTYARDFCKGLPVRFVHSDYRSFRGTFSKVVVVGMIEHVGYRNYRALLEMIYDCLDDAGLFLLHTIGSLTSATKTDAWTGKYIFPNSMAPSMQQLSRAAEGLFVLEDMHNFGQYYDPTLMAWHENFERSWPQFEASYDEHEYRMWTYYLLHFAGTFRARANQLWQFVFSKKGVPGGYYAIR